MAMEDLIAGGRYDAAMSRRRNDGRASFFGMGQRSCPCGRDGCPGAVDDGAHRMHATKSLIQSDGTLLAREHSCGKRGAPMAEMRPRRDC